MTFCILFEHLHYNSCKHSKNIQLVKDIADAKIIKIVTNTLKSQKRVNTQVTFAFLLTPHKHVIFAHLVFVILKELQIPCCCGHSFFFLLYVKELFINQSKHNCCK